MRITHMKLACFRSYTAFDWRPEDGLCVISGENAAGKTNLLEAMFLCALGRSHRTRKDTELVQSGESGGYVGLTLDTVNGSRRIECRLRQGERRQMQVDGHPLARSGELMGCLRVVLFSPEDLRLVKGGPAERRRFVDMELSQLYPAYYYRLQQYNNALRQRNALLHEQGANAPLLEAWAEQLGKLGAQIVQERAAFLARLSEAAARLHSGISAGKEQLRVTYQPSLPMADAADPERMRDILLKSGEKDALRGYTSVGPHRDDLGVWIGADDLRAFGSQGQQRTAALSLKLSQVALHRELSGDAPVLLLDDVLSELDEGRQRMLSRCIAGCQTFLTCTDAADVRRMGSLTDVPLSLWRITKNCRTPEGGAVQLREPHGGKKGRTPEGGAV